MKDMKPIPQEALTDEDRDDIAAAEHARDVFDAHRAIAADLGVEAGVPFEVLEMELAGSSPLRAWRKHRGLTQAALAQKVGIARAYLTELETGKKEGGVFIWRDLAQTLGTTIEHILPERETAATAA